MGFFIDYAWAIPAFAAVAFVAIAAFGHRTPEKGGWIALALIGLAGVFSVGVFVEALGGHMTPFSTEDAAIREFNWWSVGEFEMNMGTYVDNLTAFMLFIVGILVTLIILYSLGYMHEEGEARRRYYFEMTLFITGMLGLVVASNYLMLFIFWEIMGLCSYLLIGYWFTKPSAAAAAKKAFLTTRIGDAFFLLGLGILFVQFGTLDFDNLFQAVASGTGFDRTALLVANACIFLGAVGKSAQFPLHVWLPDAMEGPTTVSALIHAATMVKAGVYLVARSFPLFIATPELLIVVAVIGGFTALFAASMALVNNDLKRVLAYSTLSQLGYMFAALGLAGAAFTQGHTNLASAAFVIGVFHLFSHAFFKAGLFLSAGSVGHATHTYDMRLMGGLRKHMPITAGVMLLGTMSIAGIPFFSGFYSKDAILHEAFLAASEHSIYWLVYAFGLLTAGMTAYYMFRLYFMTFEGDYRGAGAAKPEKDVGAPSIAAHGHTQAPQAHGHHADHHLHESPGTMTGPLVVLGAFAVVGALAMLLLPGGGIGHFLEPALPGVAPSGLHLGGVDGVIHPFLEMTTYITLAAAALGIGLAWAWWKPGAVERNMKRDEQYTGVGKAAYRRWYFDDAYNWLAGTVVVGFAKFENWFDQNVIDGVVNGVAGFNGWLGERTRRWTTGNVQDYALTMLTGFIVIVLLVIYAPQLERAMALVRGGA